MPSISNIAFNVSFNLTGTPTLVLTDTTTTPPAGFVGIFAITQPDGYTRTGNINAPDINAAGGAFSYALRLDSAGEVQTGTYTIKFTGAAPGYLSTDFTRTFQFTYKPVTISLNEEFDVLTPSLKYSDATVYQVPGFSQGTVSRVWTAVSTPTGTVTSTAATFDIKYQNKYWDANYAITLESSISYTNQTYTYLTVIEKITKSVSTYAQTPPSLDQIVSKISDIKLTLDNSRNNTQAYLSAKDAFESAQTFFAHIIDKLKVGNIANVDKDLKDLLVVLTNYQIPSYTPTNQPINPYDYTEFTGSTKWGKISGSLSAQTDLWAYIQLFIKHDNYVHDQQVASAIWAVTHSMGKFPSVTIVDTAGDEIDAQVTHNSINQLTITFSASVAGKAYLN